MREHILAYLVAFLVLYHRVFGGLA